MRLLSLLILGLFSTGWMSCAQAQTDEIQVYDGGLAAPGKFNLTWHNNYTFKGSTESPVPGGIPVQHSLNGVTEWAYGATTWLELGLYLPLYTIGDSHIVADGFKLRALMAVPDADKRRFFYGVNFEFSQNSKRWDTHRTTSEIRPIIGWHLDRWDVIFNPILDTDYTGFSKLDFAPSMRLAYRQSERFSFALEEYADFGEISHFASGSEQSHQLFGVLDYTGKKYEIETGLGFGLTRASDDLVGKLIVAWDLN